MNQLVTRYSSVRLGVDTSSTEVITIPYNSTAKDNPIFVNLWCYGYTNISGSNHKMLFVLPIIYYSKGTEYFSIPANGVELDVLSTEFTHIEYPDITGFSTFTVTVYPQSGGGGLAVYITAIDSGTDWDFYCYADIYLEK